MKSAGPLQRFGSFQPELGQALRDLEICYNAVSIQRRSLLVRKEYVSRRWFVERQQALDSYQRALRQAAGIGRGIGDAFAWFFYQFSTELLSQHLSRKPLGQFPVGEGGHGELLVAREIQFFQGRFLVLHHSITSILRIGDVSFVDVQQMRVAGLGEIKAHHAGDGEYHAHISIISDVENPVAPAEDLQVAETQDDDAFSASLPAWIQDRLRRQVGEMRQALGAKSENTFKGADIFRTGMTSQLTCLADEARVGRPAVAKIDPSLVAAVIKLPRAKLFHRLTGDFPYPESLERMPAIAAELFESRTPHDCLHIGFLIFSDDGSPGLLPGTIPLAWSDMPMATLRRFYMSEWIPFVLFNPGWILAQLEQDGFQIRSTGPHPFDVTAERRIEGRVCSLVGFAYYFGLIRSCLLSSNDVLDLIRTLVRQSENVAKGSERYEIRLDIQLRAGSPEELPPPMPSPNKR